MRTVGKRIERPISFNASAVSLTEGAKFNEEMQRLPTGEFTGIRKGVYRFKTHEAANAHQQDCLVEAMVQIALSRRQ